MKQSKSKDDPNQNGVHQSSDPRKSNAKPIPGTQIGMKESEEDLNVQLGYPDMTGDIIQQSIVIKINEKGTKNHTPQYTQETVKNDTHVELSGTITCSGEECDSPLVLRIVPFVEQKPNDTTAPKIRIITQKNLEQTGDFEIFVPKSKSSIVVEVLVDSNQDGKPSIHERLAILEKGGQIIPFQNIGDLTIDCSLMTTQKPNGGMQSSGKENPSTIGGKNTQQSTDNNLPASQKPPPGKEPLPPPQ